MIGAEEEEAGGWVGEKEEEVVEEVDVHWFRVGN